MPRRPIGAVALTNAEKQQRYRERQQAAFAAAYAEAPAFGECCGVMLWKLDAVIRDLKPVESLLSGGEKVQSPEHS